jgi:dTDP-4-amino-4,6-dideoxygalactose transaminase
MSQPIAFIDLNAQRERLGKAMDDAILNTIHSGAYIMGPEVRQFEAELARFGEAPKALSCANGTDALALPLMAWNIGPGDAIFCPSFTFAATAEIVPWVGATPVFVDIDPDTYTLDLDHLEATIKAIIAEGKLTPKVVIGVCLFGQPADYQGLRTICDRYGMKLIADSAQGFGCTLHAKHPIYWADAATTSFFPAKPLGCYGDGGAVLVKDDMTFDLMDSLRVHGKAVKSDLEGKSFDHDPKYMNMRIGMNSRLDTVQAAILLQKLSIFADEIKSRNRVADRYNEALKAHVLKVPEVIEGGVSIWAQYTIEVKDRDGLIKHLKSANIPHAVYYPLPMHLQGPYADFPRGPGGLPVTEDVMNRVISLPMHPYLDEATQDRIIAAVIEGVS